MKKKGESRVQSGSTLDMIGFEKGVAWQWYEFRADFSIGRGSCGKKMGWIEKVILAGATLAGITFMSTSARADEKSAAVYKQKCAACHGADGKGETPTGKALKVKDFASEEVKKMDDKDLSEAISKGKGKMLAYGKSMKPEDIKAMVAYIRSIDKIDAHVFDSPADRIQRRLGRRFRFSPANYFNTRR